MSWEERDGRYYYYRKRRIGGRVVSVYVGGGDIGVFAAALDAEERAEAHARREAEQRDIDGFSRSDALLADLSNKLRSRISLMLRASGFHKHRGQWRRKRMGKKPKASLPEKTSTHDTCLAALEKAKQPEATQEDLRMFREVLAEHPDEFRLYHDMSCRAIFDAATRMFDGEVGRDLAMERYCAILRDLGYKESGAVERLLIEQVALSYFRMHHAELLYTAKTAESLPLAVASFWERKLSAAQRRYLRAVETLARVRKMVGSPAVQVNIAAQGGQQVVANRS